MNCLPTCSGCGSIVAISAKLSLTGWGSIRFSRPSKHFSSGVKPGKSLSNNDSARSKNKGLPGWSRCMGAPACSGFLAERPDVQLCAVAGRTLAKTQARAAEFGLRAYTNVQEMLAAEKPGLVSLSLPNLERFEATMQVIEAGYSLLVEKPLTFDLSEADQLLAQAEKRGLFFAINFNHRYAKPLRLAREAIKAGRLAGRTACPSVVIMDGQSVKTTERGGIRGFDAHKRVKGRKRHILVDTFGLLIACRVEPADISDRRAAALLLGGLGALFPNIRTVIADAGHQSRKLAQHLLQQDGWKLQIVKRRKRAFKITGLTWIVERSFAWLGRNRRLSKDYEYSVQTSETLIDIASTDPGKLRVSFPPERYVLFGVIHSHRVLHRDIESAAGGEIRIGKNWRRLLGENDGSTGLLRFGDFRLRAELALANGLRLS